MELIDKVAYLADTSAYARLSKKPVADRLDPLVEDGCVAVCSIVSLEILRGTATRAIAEVVDELAGLPFIHTKQADLDRAQEVLVLLGTTSQHKRAKLPDLMIAAVAERSGLIVLHYDDDFDAIATVTNQETEWVVKRGTVD